MNPLLIILGCLGVSPILFTLGWLTWKILSDPEERKVFFSLLGLTAVILGGVICLAKGLGVHHK
jgi:hypothetical protein